MSSSTWWKKHIAWVSWLHVGFLVVSWDFVGGSWVFFGFFRFVSGFFLVFLWWFYRFFYGSCGSCRLVYQKEWVLLLARGDDRLPS